MKDDDETIPKRVRNDKYVRELFDHLLHFYNDTMENKFNSIIIEQTLEYMTLEDVCNCPLHKYSLDSLNQKIHRHSL